MIGVPPDRPDEGAAEPDPHVPVPVPGLPGFEVRADHSDLRLCPDLVLRTALDLLYSDGWPPLGLVAFARKTPRERAPSSDDDTMGESQRPTVRSRRLGMLLRTVREQRGLTLQQAARLLNRTPSSLSKLETGTRGIRRPALENMLDRYEVTDEIQREELFALARSSGTKGWWQRYEGILSPADLDYISLEADATSIQSLELHLIPGLLQIEEYARALIASEISQGQHPNADNLATIRMRRQQIVSAPNPPQLWMIVSEAALRQQVGGPEVMQAQLQRLVEAFDLGNVTLQVLPFSAGAHAGHNGSFTMLTTSDLSVVLVENLTTGWYLEEAADISRHDLVFDHLRATALSPSSSRSMIERLMSGP